MDPAWRWAVTPRAWYSRIDDYFTEQGFKKSSSESTLYVKEGLSGKKIIISLYVDDLVLTGNDEQLIAEFKRHMKENFEMNDLGLMNYFLGIEVEQQEGHVFISQRRYLKELLSKFNMEGCKAVATPFVTHEKFYKDDGSPKADPSLYRSMIGSLLYLSSTRPNIQYATNMLSQFTQAPSENHLSGVKRIFRYLQGSKNYGIHYHHEVGGTLHGYTDSDWAGSLEDMRSISGYAFSIGSNIFSWISRKQKTTSQSTAEAEYVAAALAANQTTWLRYILTDLGELQQGPTRILCDSKSAICMSKNPVFHSRSNDQLADCFTKGLQKVKLAKLRRRIGVQEK
ncbi:uncharacterized mitochondrial protein AtMg00810-like isoform X2 [Tripterygium wilfordii]|uniref:uncharacterized mitochondrial protein AtMg00810-like isoform X1 n=1 Tax=Tripterygium wilfordii TaxID=458696 RepID=UPI0018F84945|nr:uncharacterized mitochondrial protein AtMg00810-like isoform X1 [Tripterygium wilfordii]XP_038687180.1 uncharacterized mitochondrial protein AtMg00810-like isoform X2 [Tripterygium wilfordii]